VPSGRSLPPHRAAGQRILLQPGPARPRQSGPGRAARTCHDGGANRGRLPRVPVRRLRLALPEPGPPSALYCAGRAGVSGAQLAAACVLAAGAAIIAGLTVAGQAGLTRLWFRHRIEVIRGEAVLAIADGNVPVTSHVTAWLAALDATLMPLTECPLGRSPEFPTRLTLNLLRLVMICHGPCRRVVVVL
jgi:hypothetical protein